MKSYILKLYRLLRDKKISSTELTKLYIDRIERTKDLNAYVLNTFDTALNMAKKADTKLINGEGGYLTGIPFSLKDNICTQGIETTCCSGILQGFKPSFNATAYQRLLNADTVLLGKTNMDEFGMGSNCENSYFGATKNPIDESKVAGGSSGGSAAAVCANLGAYSLGTDTGGSVRLPASYCGVVGFKPTYGAISRYGVIAYASSLEQIGIIARSVDDVALVYDCVKGYDSMDSTSANISKEHCALFGDINGLKIGVVDELFEGADKAVTDCVRSALKAYEARGAKLVSVKLNNLASALSAYYVIASSEASSNLGRYDGVRFGKSVKGENFEDTATNTRTCGFGSEVKKRIMLGTYCLSTEHKSEYYLRAIAVRESIKREINKILQCVDFIATPTSPNTAVDRGYIGGKVTKGYSSDVYTAIANLAELPAISLPCGEKDGLPIGLQLMGAPFKDGELLNLAYFAQIEGVARDFCIAEDLL